MTELAGLMVGLGLAVALVALALMARRSPSRRVLDGYLSRRASSRSRLRRWHASISGRHRLDADREVASCDGSRFWSGRM